MNLMPSIVMEVSAMFVDTTHFRTPSGATSKTWQEKKIHAMRNRLQGPCVTVYARCTLMNLSPGKSYGPEQHDSKGRTYEGTNPCD